MVQPPMNLHLKKQDGTQIDFGKANLISGELIFERKNMLEN